MASIRFVIEMTMTSPMCPAGPQLVAGAKGAAGELEEVGEVDVKVVMDPPWNQEMMTEDARDHLAFFSWPKSNQDWRSIGTTQRFFDAILKHSLT